jgi:hypothetical protein
MLTDRKKYVEENAKNRQRCIETVIDYAQFLSSHFSLDDWFVTITLRDRHKDLEPDAAQPSISPPHPVKVRLGTSNRNEKIIRLCGPDPRIEAWEPSSRFRREPGPPVPDAALREIEHWLFELGWEAAGRSRQEIFDWLATRKSSKDRKSLARKLSGTCLFCQLLTKDEFEEQAKIIRTVSTNAIGWVIAEELGRLGGRWHVHLLVRGVTKLRRMKWWRRAFNRFGRARIEPIHE